MAVQLATVKEAASLLRVHPETVRTWCVEGLLSPRGSSPAAGGGASSWTRPAFP